MLSSTRSTAASGPLSRVPDSGALREILELAMAHESFEALLDKLFRLFPLDLLQGLRERLLERRRSRLRVAMRAASGSLTILSTSPSVFSLFAVMPSASAASGAYRRCATGSKRNPPER